MVLLKLEAVLFEFALKLPGGEHSIGSRVTLYFAFYEEEERSEDVDAQPYWIVNDDRVLRNSTELRNECAPRSAVTDEAKARR